MSAPGDVAARARSAMEAQRLGDAERARHFLEAQIDNNRTALVAALKRLEIEVDPANVELLNAPEAPADEVSVSIQMDGAGHRLMVIAHHFENRGPRVWGLFPCQERPHPCGRSIPIRIGQPHDGAAIGNLAGLGLAWFAQEEQGHEVAEMIEQHRREHHWTPAHRLDQRLISEEEVQQGKEELEELALTPGERALVAGLRAWTAEMGLEG